MGILTHVIGVFPQSVGNIPLFRFDFDVERQSPQNVYDVIRDFTSAPAWRSDVKRVEVQTQPGGRVHLREEGKNGTVNYELAEDVPGKRMVTQILDTDLGYSGKWTYVFAPENGGARVAASYTIRSSYKSMIRR
jgi:Polyketide cyclase / dehydrase and lipid transport